MPLKTPIFVSYRRDDSGPDAQFIATHLRQQLGNAEVFCDVTSITPGQRWPKRLRLEVERAETVVAVIGPGWLTAADQWGRRRLDQAGDWVRCELKKALGAGKHVVPVTVRGARMPAPEGLPPALRPLAECQGIEVRRDYQEHDLELLVSQFAKAARPALPLAEEVAAAIAEQMEAARSRDLKFRSPHLVRALVGLPNSLTSECLEIVRPGYSDELHTMLNTYFSRQGEKGEELGFVAFRAGDHPIVRAAAEIAGREGAAAIEERHLLLAFLESDAALAARFRTDLGDSDYERLKQTVERRRWPRVVPGRTPARLLESKRKDAK